jgi:zinc-ribbon domain
MSALYCSHCGASLQPTDRFCTVCGTPVMIAGSSANIPAPSLAPLPVYSNIPALSLAPLSASVPLKQRKPWKGCLIGACVVLFILLCSFYTLVKTIGAYNPSLFFTAQGTCRITMQQYERAINRGKYNSLYSKEQVQYTLTTADGRTVQGSSYDWVDDIVTDEPVDQAQAFAAHYHVGQSYPCWYNPLFPSASALSRAPDVSRLPSPNVNGGGFYSIMYFVGYIAIGLLLFLLICILPVVIILNVVLRFAAKSQSRITP